MTKTTENNSASNTMELSANVQAICKALSEKMATDIKVVDIKGMSDLADYFVICSARSAAQVKAVFEHMEEELEKLGKFVVRKEGVSEGKWIAADYGDIIVHIFHKDLRGLYALENLWDKGNNILLYND